ncbi:MAG TPA: hypothetical protein VLH16_01665 [Bacteroidales bacterium]|nr:hypothetical protein [Bacteroidales bacterium]
MSDQLRHECGIALIRLLQPLEYYLMRYGSAFWALNKLHLLMEKQHNRGQDGAGIACVKFDMSPGQRYLNRLRSANELAVNDLFLKVFEKIHQVAERYPDRLRDVNWLRNYLEFTGELFLGHLRYGTYGKNGLENVHPVLRENNWKTKTLVLAGNFNLTNVDEMFGKLIDLGQHPLETSDTVTILERIGHFLDEANEELYRKYKQEGLVKRDISQHIATNLDIPYILKRSANHWDGGYVIAGIFGHGDAFVMRDPNGIRPAFYYADNEVIVATSERPAIQTAFNIPEGAIRELLPGHALVIRKDGSFAEHVFKDPADRRPCSFERIYFSRGTDADIYRERKMLGQLLVPPILEATNHDFENTVFSYIPNTAAVAFYGLVEKLNELCNNIKKERLMRNPSTMTETEVSDILSFGPRIEKVAVKDIKLRTFITQDLGRDDLVAHVYDVTYGIIRRGIDTLVILDDSIVRGTTLKQSIIRILDRLGPKHIVIASSAPQVRYPDCYGIDMAKLTDFVAFNAAIDLLKETRQTEIISHVYRKCKEQEKLPKEQMVNYVREIYRPFSVRTISEKIAALVTPSGTHAKVSVVFNTIENLHQACPRHTGDWYFTGNYPTPGGVKVVTQAYINFIEGRNVRAY